VDSAKSFRMSLLLVLARNRTMYFFLVVAAIFISTNGAVEASIVFNWPDTPGWTAGAPAQGQTVTQQFTSVNPNDISVSLENDGVNIQATYPQINSNNETGGFTGVNALQLYISSTPTFGNSLKTTVSFASPVTNLSFQIWDVDASAGQFADKIVNLQGLAPDGTTVIGPSSVTSAVAGFNTITGTGLSTVITGTNPASNTTNQGTINVLFTGPLTQFSFEWSNNDNGRGAQAIALGPLTYDVVPESSNWALVSPAFCLAAIISEKLLRRRRCRSPKQKS
jgi:hypothetical protein